MISTFIISAFWHGFYFGYYSTFIFAALITEAHGKWNERFRPIYFSGEDPKNPKKSIKYYFYRFASIVFTTLMLNYIVLGFLVLSMENTFIIHKKLYFSGHIFGFLYILFVNMLPKPKPKEKTN
jgi:lysophospholipid acyltransferase